MFCRGLLVVALVAALAAPVYGQRGAGRGRGGLPGNGNGPQGADPQGGGLTSIDGNIEGLGSGGLKVKTESGQTVVVAVSPATKVQYTGKATVDFLRNGVAIEFTAEVDEKHVVKEAVTQLTIVSLSAGRGAGLFAEGSSGAKPAEVNNFAFGPAPAGDAPAAKPAKEKKPAAHKGPAEPVKLPATCVVRGTIKGLKAGKLTLNIGRGSVKGEVDDNAEITVDTTDLRCARKGDSISVKGQGAGGTMAATSITIQGAEPLTGPKKKVHSPAKKDASGADAGAKADN